MVVDTPGEVSPERSVTAGQAGAQPGPAPASAGKKVGAQSFLGPVAAWWPAGIAGLAGGLFLSRLAYELWPVQAASLAYWPATASLAAAALASTLALRYAWLRQVQAARCSGRKWPFGQAGPSPFLPGVLLAAYVLWPGVQPVVGEALLAGTLGLSIALAWRSLRTNLPIRLWQAGCTLGPAGIMLAVYLGTMGRTVGEADSFEFQVVAPTLGIPHPTGYPLFILIGKLFSLLPVGQVAWRVNLVSVVFGVVAAALLAAILVRLTDQRGTAALAALTLAFSRVYWSQATRAEVYTLNAAFVVALLAWLVEGLARQDRSEDLGGGRARAAGHWFPLLAGLYGLSLTHHLTMVLLAPAIAAGLWFARKLVRRRDWLPAAGMFLLGLSFDLYIPLRWPALRQGQTIGLAEYLGWISGHRFGGALQPGLWNDPTRWRILGELTWTAFGPAGAALAAAGLAWLAVRRGRLAVVSGLAWSAYFAYGLIYNVPDVSVFVLPAYIVMALWIGVGAAALVRWVSRRWPPNVTGLAWVALAVLPLSLFWGNLPAVDQSQAGWDLYRWGRYVLSLPLPAGATILADSEKIAPLYYLTQIEHLRPDVEAMVLGDEKAYLAVLQQRVAAGRPVYLARYLPGIAGQYRLGSLGPLVHVTTTAEPAPAIQHRLADATWGEGQIALLGYDARPGEDSVAWRVTLYWLAQGKPAASYHVRLRWVGEDGKVWWEDPGAHPVGGFSPTAAWQTGEVVPDYHEVPADPAIPVGSLRLEIGLFLPFQDNGPNADGKNSPWLKLGDLKQPAEIPVPSPSQILRACYGDELLIAGMNDPGVSPPGEPVDLTFAWARLKPGSGQTLRLTLTDATGAEATAVTVAPYAGEYPVSRWPVGQMLAGRVPITAPLASGTYTVHAAWLDAAGETLPAHCGWLAVLRHDCPAGTLHVEGAARGEGINFDNQVILLQSQPGRAELQPGGTLDVTLRWQGLRKWPADYTAFVHLVGPDGKLHGQVDQWPVQGTLATSEWEPGRIVDDPYHVRLDGDAPSGMYQVEVGWYLLATLRRVPVLDAAGRPADDRAIIGTVTVPP